MQPPAGALALPAAACWHLSPSLPTHVQEHGFAEKRSAKLSQDDFLQLLAAFNAAGIHFA